MLKVKSCRVLGGIIGATLIFLDRIFSICRYLADGLEDWKLDFPNEDPLTSKSWQAERQSLIKEYNDDIKAPALKQHLELVAAMKTTQAVSPSKVEQTDSLSKDSLKKTKAQVASTKIVPLQPKSDTPPKPKPLPKPKIAKKPTPNLDRKLIVGSSGKAPTLTNNQTEKVSMEPQTGIVHDNVQSTGTNMQTKSVSNSIPEKKSDAPAKPQKSKATRGPPLSK